MKSFSMNSGEYSPRSLSELPPEIDEEVEDELSELGPDFNESQEKKGEQIEIKIETIADFIKALELSYDTAPDRETKQQIGYQIIKINMALNLSKYSAEDVKVEEMSAGVLGLHYTGEKQSAISEELLSDFNVASGLIAHVLEHERMHEIGIDDEGPAELKLRNRSLTTVTFYVTEQQKAKRAFHNIGTDKALDLYDMNNPEKLLDCYLEVELEKKYKYLKTELKNLQGDTYLSKKVIDEADILSTKLKEGVPRFFDRLSRSTIKIRIREILMNLREKK